MSNFFFHLRKKTIYFFAMNVRHFFFFFVEELKYIFLPYAFSIMYVTICGFSGQHNFHQFRQQTFFSDHIFNKLFFLTFVAINFFSLFSSPPPISNGTSLKWLSTCQPESFPLATPIGCDAGLTMWR